MLHNKAFKSDSQRLAVSLRSSIAKRRSHLNAALCLIHKNQQFVVVDSFGISFRFCRQFNIVCRCLMKRQCVWC
ncbi:hypothetical protein FLM00_19615 [Vibrio cholerae]|nr:hypothetical protein FLM00_19615 [Vibrio cholerae]